MRFLAVGFLWCSLFFCGVTAAQEQNADLEPPPPPEIPAATVSGDPMEPEVTIRQQQGARIAEYRYGGQLRIVRIQPSVGPPYYLIDRDGNGSLEHRMSQLPSDIVVSQWILFSW